MKRVAIILVSIFLLLSIAITVYILVSIRLEIGKNAEPTSQSTDRSTIIAQAPTEAPTQPPPTMPPANTPTQIVSTTPNQLPLCTGLSASPTSGKIPLTVLFIGSGTDLDGTLQKFEFNYGDGQEQTIAKNVGDTGNIEISHTYTQSGGFTASLRLVDNSGGLSAPTELCRVAIITTGGKVAGETTENIGQPNLTPTVTPTPTVKITGTVTPTRTPTPTKVASASATPVTAPNVPTAGGILPTLIVGIGGLLILSLGLLFAL